MQPRLIGLGAVLFVVGALILAFAIGGFAREDRAEPLAGAAVATDQPAASPFVRLLPIVGGVSLAAGAALVGIGMNRWTGRRSRERSVS